MNISKFVIVAGGSAGGMNALTEFVSQLDTRMGSTVFIVSMGAFSKGNVSENRRKFSGIWVDWLYKLDEAGIVIPIGRYKLLKSKNGLIF